MNLESLFETGVHGRIRESLKEFAHDDPRLLILATIDVSQHNNDKVDFVGV